MSDYEELKYYTSLTRQEVYRMIGSLSKNQFEMFCETLEKIECVNFSAEISMRKALFIARSYPIE